jgi:hypothetical protein
LNSSSSSKPVSKLTALKKQIAALEAQAERIAKAEMSSAIAKIKDIMSEFNLTIEHLTQTVTVTGKRAAKKTKAKEAARPTPHSTVTLFAKFLGLSTSVPRAHAV